MLKSQYFSGDGQAAQEVPTVFFGGDGDLATYQRETERKARRARSRRSRAREKSR